MVTHARVPDHVESGATISIPYPRPTQNANRGRDVYDGPPSRPTTIRFTDGDRAKIENVAKSLGMAFGEFTRWAAYWMAHEVGNEQHRKSFETPKKIKEVDLTGFE